MTEYRTVNDTLDQIEELRGQAVEIEGILMPAFDLMTNCQGYWLLHYPKTERRFDGDGRSSKNKSTLWLEFGDGSIRPNHSVLIKWDGKRVRVHGVIFPAKGSSTCGLFEGNSAFYPYLEVYSVQRVTSEQRREIRGKPSIERP